MIEVTFYQINIVRKYFKKSLKTYLYGISVKSILPSLCINYCHIYYDKLDIIKETFYKFYIAL